MTNEEYKLRLAENFDARSLDYNADNFHGRLADRIIALADPRPGESLLDVATGSGLAAIAAARLVGVPGRVVGVDLSPGMLALASKSVAAEGLENVELIHADAETMDFPPESFDVVTCVSAVPYLTDIPAAMLRWRDWLRPGGRVAFNCWSEASYLTGHLVRTVAARHGITLPVTGDAVNSPARCRSALLGAGFAEVEVAVEPSGHFVAWDRVEKAWDGWVQNPIFQPRDPEQAARLLGLRDDYLAEARDRAVGQGVWDEMTAYFVLGRK